MNLHTITRRLLIASAAVTFGPAIFLLIAPTALMSVYGLELDRGGAFQGRVLGAVLLGLALLFWQARQSEVGALQRTALWAALVHNAALVLVIVSAVLSGIIIWTGWPAAALHAILAISAGAVLRHR